jgi:Ca2+-binding RTX toxin-like protein
MFRKMFATVGVAGLLLAGAAVGTASAAKADNGNEKVTICHATGSATNPYVEITISVNALPAHLRHQDGRDIIPAPVTGCGDVTPTPDPGPNPNPGPSVECVVGPGVTQTATTVTGTAANDTIDCTNASPGKTIVGGDGNDTITGTAFNDTIDGGNGNDTITGGPGDDFIEGGNGNDTLTGSGGNDVVVDTGDGEDTITQ